MAVIRSLRGIFGAGGALLFFFLLYAQGQSSDKTERVDKPIRAPEPAFLAALEEGCRLGIGYLLANCSEEGRFAYIRYEDPIRKDNGYNLLRHCGAIYALGMAAEAYPERLPEIRPVISRACSFLRKNELLLPLPNQSGMLALWKLPGRVDNRASGGEAIIAKLGGAGLCLLALLAEDKYGEGLSVGAEGRLAQMRQLANFILFMQRTDGSFFSRYRYDAGRDDSFRSLYYPGEAILALLMLYRVDPDTRWLEAAQRGTRYLVHTRNASGQYPPDHWILLASAELAPLLSAGKAEATGLKLDELLTHTRAICQTMVNEQIVDTELPGFGAFRRGGETCPASTRVEGMQAALRFLPAEEPLTAQIRACCDRALRFLYKAQIKRGELSGGVPRATVFLAEPSPEEMAHLRQEYAAERSEEGEDAVKIPDFSILRRIRNHNARMNEVRIDYVQHALCAALMRLYPTPPKEGKGRNTE